MATENVGGIQYTVDADTSDLIAAEAQTKKFTSNTAKSFSTAEASTKKFNAQVSGTAKAVRSARPDMQNMSYQLQDMAVQAQMGTSAFVIMAQQLPQMLVGMGAWAGAIGVAVTVLGLLATTTIDTTKDLEKIEKSIERVKAVMTVGAHGITSYSDEMRKLGTLSKDIVKIKLANALAEQENALRNMGGAAREAYEQALPFYNFTKGSSSSLFSGIVDDKDVKNLGAASPEISKARSGIEQLTTAVRLLESGGEANLATGFKVMTSALNLLSDSAAQNTDKGRELIASLTSLSEEYTSSTIRAKALNDVLNSGETSIKGNADALQSFLKEMHMSNTLLSEGERAALKLKLAQDGLKDSEISIALAAYDYNQELVVQKEATEAAVEADKKRKKSLDDVSDSLDAYFDKESADSTKKDTTATAKLTTQVQSVGLTPEQEIQARYDAEIELLRRAEEKKIEIEGTYADRRTQLEKERLESVRALQSDNNEFLEAAFGNLDTQIAGTMASVVTGAQSGEDALKSLATTIITQVVGALIQEGITSAMVSAGFIAQKGAETAAVVGGIGAQTAAATAATGVTTAASVASGAAITAAMAPAAAATSIATAGAAPAAASGIALSSMGMIIAGLVGATALAGAREFGGPVTAGKSYLVGERGPEMFTPGSSGGITSNKDMASGGQMNVIINNNAAGVDVSANQIDQRTVEISVRKSMQEFANQASTGQGVAINALTRNTNVTRKGGV